MGHYDRKEAEVDAWIRGEGPLFTSGQTGPVGPEAYREPARIELKEPLDPDPTLATVLADAVRLAAESNGSGPALAPAAFVTKSTPAPERVWSTGSRRDSATGKGRFDLLLGGFAHPLRRLAQLLERGAERYGENNWTKGQPLSSYLSSAGRHITDFAEGDRSEDHVVAAIWNLCAYVATEKWINDGRLPADLDDVFKP